MAGLILVNGFQKVIYWTVSEVKRHAERYSQSYRKYKKTGNQDDAIWASQFEKMAEKTVLKALISRYGIMSTAMQQAVKSDQSKLQIDLDAGEENIEYIDVIKRKRTNKRLKIRQWKFQKKQEKNDAIKRKWTNKRLKIKQWKFQKKQEKDNRDKNEVFGDYKKFRYSAR